MQPLSIPLDLLLSLQLLKYSVAFTFSEDIVIDVVRSQHSTPEP